MCQKSKHSSIVKKDFKLKDYLSISVTKKSTIAGITVMLTLIAALSLYIFPNRAAEFTDYTLGMIINYSFPVLIGLVIALKFEIKNNRLNQIFHLVLLFIIPVVLLVMSEALNELLEYGFTKLAFFGGYFLILFLLLTVFAVLGSFKLSFITVSTFVFLMSVANYYVTKFRGTPFLPMDFYAAKTAANVAFTYDFSPEPVLIFSAFLFVFVIIFFVKIKAPKFSLAFKISSRTASAVVSVITVILFTSTSFFINLGVIPDFWSPHVSCRNQGFLLNFTSTLKYLYSSAPQNYDSGDIDKYIAEVYNSNENKNTESKTPNIICIMNEALSDLGVLGNFETNEDYMPFMHNLTDNTVKGNLHVPVLGGGTANSEFEFLTGHSMSFLPYGTYAYTTNVRKPIASMVSTLKAQGYTASTFHPYYLSGWNRTEAYGNLGFENFISIENMLDDDFLISYKTYENRPDDLQAFIEKNYPQNTNMLVRQFVSDSYDFERVIDEFESRDKSKPYFMFNVTMQNHGGYTMSYANFQETIKTTSLSKTYDDVNRYLSLIKKTDEAFEDLINYFENVDEPTVICMFGDHQPSLDSEFLCEVMGVNDLNALTVEQNQSRYCTPFFIWVNYDIEERFFEALSANYLSSLVLETAGVKLTEYNKYLLKLSEILPVIDTVGYVDNQGVHYKWSDVSPYNDLLDDYEKIQYNNIFDQKNVDADIFYINGFVPEATILEDMG